MVVGLLPSSGFAVHAESPITYHIFSFGTGVGVDPVSSSNPYSLTLRSGSDVVSVGGLSAGKVSLYTIIKQTATFGVDPFSGIQGKRSTKGKRRGC